MKTDNKFKLPALGKSLFALLIVGGTIAFTSCLEGKNESTYESAYRYFETFEAVTSDGNINKAQSDIVNGLFTANNIKFIVYEHQDYIVTELGGDTVFLSDSVYFYQNSVITEPPLAQALATILDHSEVPITPDSVIVEELTVKKYNEAIAFLKQSQKMIIYIDTVAQAMRGYLQDSITGSDGKNYHIAFKVATDQETTTVSY